MPGGGLVVGTTTQAREQELLWGAPNVDVVDVDVDVVDVDVVDVVDVVVVVDDEREHIFSQQKDTK